MKILLTFILLGSFFLINLPAAPTVSNVVAQITNRVDNGKGMITRSFSITYDLANTNGKSCRIFPGVQGVEKNPVLTDEGPYLWVKNIAGDTATMAGTGKHITLDIADTAGEFTNCRVKLTAWDRDSWAPLPNRPFNPRHHSWAQDVRNCTAHPKGARFITWMKTRSPSFLVIAIDFNVYTVMGNHHMSPAISPGGESDTNHLPIPMVTYGDPSDCAQEGLDAPGSCSGDCHIEMLDVEKWIYYSAIGVQYSGGTWSGGDEAAFPLYSEVYLKKSAALVPITGEKPSTIGAYRSIGATSTDAAGLSVTPGLVLLQELADGEINHALRTTSYGSRNYYVHPASHQAGKETDSFAVPMGIRFRLKNTWDINTHMPLTGTPGTTAYRDLRAARIMLRAIQKYGMINADNSGGMQGGYLMGERDSHTELKWANLGSASCLATQMYLVPLSWDDFEVVDWASQYKQYAHYDSLYFNR